MRFALRQDRLSSASCIFHYQIMDRRCGEDDLRIPLHQSTAGEVEWPGHPIWDILSRNHCPVLFWRWERIDWCVADCDSGDSHWIIDFCIASCTLLLHNHKISTSNSPSFNSSLKSLTSSKVALVATLEANISRYKYTSLSLTKSPRTRLDGRFRHICEALQPFVRSYPQEKAKPNDAKPSSSLSHRACC